MWQRMERFVGRCPWMTVVARWLVGAVFIFSSVVKGVEPYGTVLKIEEYLMALGMDFALPLAEACAVALVGVEMLIGGALIVDLWPRLVAIVTLCVNGFYLLLTLWIAVAEPVADCGCFGDVVTLTNWQTFGKNVVLTLLSVVALAGSKVGGDRVGWRLATTLTLGVAVVAVAIYSLIALPLVDRFPFGEGVNIPRAVDEEMHSADASRIVCRNLHTGQERAFAVDDSTWWDESEWEYVRTESPESRLRVRPSEFRLFAGDVDMTLSVLQMPACRLFCVEDVESLSSGDVEKMQRLADECIGRGERVVVVSSSRLLEVAKRFPNMEICNADAMVLRALLRAPAGVVTIERGTIVHKASLRALSL